MRHHRRARGFTGQNQKEPDEAGTARRQDDDRRPLDHAEVICESGTGTAENTDAAPAGEVRDRYRALAAKFLPSEPSGRLVGWRIRGLVGVIVGVLLIYFGMLALSPASSIG